ncbi:DinB family protein, partial [Flavobacterium hydatis]
LCLHLIGNLNTYIGAALGDSGYIRHRELEFSLKNIPRAELITKIEATIVVVDTALSNLSEKDLEQEFPVFVFEGKNSTDFILTHLTTHLAYHLGQINYHRRLLDDVSMVDG